MRQSLESLSEDDREWLARIHAESENRSDLPDRVDQAIRVNQNFLYDLDRLIPAITRFPREDPEPAGAIAARVRLLPWAVAREWGSDFNSERELTYQPIYWKLKELLPAGAKVLVPGAGCCRLAYEIAARGFEVTAIEFDALKLLAAAQMFALGLESLQTEIRPYALETCNRMSASDNTRPIYVPDALMTDNALSRLTINGNEFVETARTMGSGEFDAVVTSFFMDTTTTSDLYMNKIIGLLKPGGWWINCGPFNYHYPSEKTVPLPPAQEPNVEEFMLNVTRHGFTVAERMEIDSTYMGNPSSMMQTKYRCLFFAAQFGQ
jgi:carnosine N-methyltransferase